VRVVYFIQSGDGGQIKVGTTDDLPYRLRLLQSGNPEELTVLATLPGGRREEAQLHRALLLHRRRGEWFVPAPELLQAVVLAKAGASFEQVLDQTLARRDITLLGHRLHSVSMNVRGLRKAVRAPEQDAYFVRRCFAMLRGAQRRQAEMISRFRGLCRFIRSDITIIAEGEGQVRG
jgi:hypothetical protein